MSSDHRFQVNLLGVIDLLSKHLYSGPDVYVRELLQNAVDAITARERVEPDHQSEISIELTDGPQPTLCAYDNGIGLTSDEVHHFLATIGRSSKRESLSPEDFIGQFGIGVLSAFVVSEEIVVITRSTNLKAKPVEWRGRSDGTYTVRELDRDMAPGTQVFLTAKPDMVDYFDPEFVKEKATYFGRLLPFPIRVVANGESTPINETPPWRLDIDDVNERREAILTFGREAFDTQFIDYIPLFSDAGDVEGVAFVLPFAGSLAARRTHRVYVKNMLLSEKADNLLPEWAFFVKCVVNANGLTPTASRESFYEDETLDKARQTLGDCLREHLVRLAQEDRRRLDAFIALHYLALKALAVDDDEFYRLFADWLPVETSLGRMTLGECRKLTRDVRFVPTCDQFRQVSAVAAAQSLCIINGGYTYDSELVSKMQLLDDSLEISQLDIAEMSQNFGELSVQQRGEMAELLRVADDVLRPFRCEAEVKKFSPHSLPTLYTANRDANFLRSVERTQDVANDLWSGVLERLADGATSSATARLCLNYNNTLVRRLAQFGNEQLVRRSVEMLYIQSLMLGHFPMRAQELNLMTDGLLGLIETAIDDAEDES